MSLFSRNKNDDEEPADATLDLDDDDAEAVSAPPVAEVEEPAEDDQTEQVVQELYDRLGQLSANVEARFSSQDETATKLQALEDQMRKLASLTEAVSARYNPFLGEAEEEREPIPAAKAAVAVPEVPAEVHEHHDEPASADDDAPEVHDDDVSVAAAPAMEWARPEEDAPLQVQVDEHAPDHHDEDLPAWNDGDHVQRGAVDAGPRLRDVGACFTTSQLMLRWANLLLASAGDRDRAADFVDHYKRIGWLGDDAGDRLVEYVDGLTLLDGGGHHDAHGGTAQVHEMSLLYVERLSDHARGCACVPRP